MTEAKKSTMVNVEIAPKIIVDLEPKDLQITVAPPEIFQENEGEEIIDIASNGNYAIVLRRKTDEFTKGIIYNELGKKVISKMRVFPMNIAEFIQWYRDSNQDSDTLRFFKGHSSYPNYFQPWVKKLYPDVAKSELEKIRKGFIKTLKKTDYWHRDWVIPPEAYMTPLITARGEMRIKTDTSEDYFVVDNGRKEVFLVKTRDQGKVLDPNDWIVQHFTSREALRKKLTSLPEDLDSELLIFNDRAVRVPNTDLVALFEESGILSVIDTGTRQRLFSSGARDFSLDPADGDTLITINPEKSKTLTLIKASEIAARNWQLINRELSDIKGEPLEIRLDPHGNFVLIVSRDNANGWLSIFDKESLKKIHEIDNVKGKLEVDRNGNIFFADSQERLRMASTNFKAYKKGMAFAKAKAERTKRLREKLKDLTPEELDRLLKEKEKPKVKEGEPPETAAKRALKEKLEELFGERIKEAKTLEEVGSLNQQLEGLKEIPEFADYPEAFSLFEKKIRNFENNIKLGQLDEILAELQEEFLEIKSFEDALSIEERLKELLTIRQEVAIKNRTHRREVNKAIKTLSEQAEQHLDKFQQEFLDQISEQFESVEKLIKSSGSTEEISDLKVAPEVEILEGWIAKIKDAGRQRELRTKLREAFRTQDERINLLKAQTEAEERFRAAAIIEDIKAATEDLSGLIETTISTPSEFDSWSRNNPHITKIHAQILGLPSDLRKEQEEKLDEFFRKKRYDVEYKKRLGIRPKEKGKTVKFGKEVFPIYTPPKIVWQPKIIQLAPGSNYGRLIFEDNLGSVYRPEVGSVPVNMEDVTTSEVIKIFSPDAAEYFNSLKRQVPEFNENWVLSNFFTQRLEEMARLLNNQAEKQRGILILEGEAGTGKNVLFEILAHFSNREFFNFACNMQTEKEDITYAFRFDPVKGTYQVDSRVIEAIRTPGAIINFDELNTLPPGVSKMLNPLLDHRRTLFFPEGKKQQKANSSVLITATMNPQHYLGTKPLSQEVKSRSRIMTLDFPPEKKGRKISPDEAMIYAKYIDSLQDLTPEEFTKLWDYHINKEVESGGDKFSNPGAEAGVKKIAELIKIANLIRDAYKAFRTGQSTEMIEFVFSIREGIDIVSEMEAFPHIKEAIKDVVLPKIADPIEKEKVKLLIEQT